MGLGRCRAGNGRRVITVDDANPTPPFEQIRAQLANLIAVGALARGDRLPSVRQLAADLRLAPGTVARAYTELESQGLIDSKRGAGTRVSANVEAAPQVWGAAAFVAQARAQGLDLDEAILALRAAWG